jgi:hypothetical protein
MKHWFRILLICLFALLQSVAPLAHAHINGDHANGSVHAVELEHALFGELNFAEPAFSTPDSPSIGMPHELQREISLDLCGTALFSPTPPPEASRLLYLIGGNHHALLNTAVTPYEIPFSHAPPALA